MRCADCLYYWKNKEDKFPCCHFEGAEGWAPCEQDDEETYDESSEE